MLYCGLDGGGPDGGGLDGVDIDGPTMLSRALLVVTAHWASGPLIFIKFIEGPTYDMHLIKFP